MENAINETNFQTLKELLTIMGQTMMIAMKDNPVCFLQLDGEDITGYPDEVLEHQGLYAFRVSYQEKSALIYLGKDEKGKHLRQHLTGKNKNGISIKASGHNKYEFMKRFLKTHPDIVLSLCLYTHLSFDKASLAGVETAAAISAKMDFEQTFISTEKFKSIKHWNHRLG